MRPLTSTLAISEQELVGRVRNERRVVAARARRVVLGASLIAGALALVLRSLIGDIVGVRAVPSSWEVVTITWLVALLSAIAAGPLSRLLPTTRPTMDTDDDLLVASLTLPAAGLALFLPITIHMPFAIFLAGTEGFDTWCTWSVALVGHAHIVLAVLAAHRAAAHVEGSAAALDDAAVRSPVSIYLITILVSAVPFGMSSLAPPFLVAITGLPILILLHRSEHIVSFERKLLSSGHDPHTRDPGRTA